MQYPLLFPTGRDGWNINVTSLSNHKKVTLNAFTSFHLMERNGIFNPIHFANKLGQQFIVGQYCKIEMDRLSWIKRNQKHLRSDLYFGLEDNLHINDLERTGTPIILPASYMGGP